MTRSSLSVVKVGGSLFDWPELPRRFAAFVNPVRTADRNERLILIAGGGPAAELVRSLDRVHGLGNQRAHRLALAAMDLTALLLAELVPDTVLVDSVETLPLAWTMGSIPVLVPRPVLAEIDGRSREPLPASWDVTSDSIAARIAAYLGANRLVLLKSAPLPTGATRRDAARLGLVDPMLPIVARSLLSLEYLNLREPAGPPQSLPP